MTVQASKFTETVLTPLYEEASENTVVDDATKQRNQLKGKIVKQQLEAADLDLRDCFKLIGKSKKRLEEYSKQLEKRIALKNLSRIFRIDYAHIRCDKITRISAEVFSLDMRIFEVENSTLYQFPEAAEFGRWRGLTTLKFLQCNLPPLPSNFFSALPSLKELSLSNTPLQQLPDLSSLTKLECLQLDGTNLSSLPEDSFPLPNLQSLYLNDNKLTRLPEGIFSSCESLAHLKLNNNRLSSFSISTKELTQLQLLNLDANLFTAPPKELLELTGKVQIIIQKRGIPEVAQREFCEKAKKKNSKITIFFK